VRLQSYHKRAATSRTVIIANKLPHLQKLPVLRLSAAVIITTAAQLPQLLARKGKRELLQSIMMSPERERKPPFHRRALEHLKEVAVTGEQWK